MSPSSPLRRLHTRMRVCRLCLEAGHEITPGAIFSGSDEARVMIIGQAPGETEVEAGRPFNAGSGTRLFDWLRSAGLDETHFRRDQYLTAVTKCFPGKARNGSGDRVPTRREQALCRPYLDEEIRLVNPALIIPIGRLAINLFFPGHHPLRQIIGREIEAAGRSIIPLPHPSGASRWHQSEANRELIRRALSLLHERSVALGIIPG